MVLYERFHCTYFLNKNNYEVKKIVPISMYTLKEMNA